MYAAKLKEIGLAEHDAAELEAHAVAVQGQIVRMRAVLRQHSARAREQEQGRVWLRGESSVGIDDDVDQIGA